MQQKVDLLDQDVSQSHDPSDHRTRLKHREQYTALIDRLKTIIAPHKHIPAELLTEIFHLTLPHGFRVYVLCRFLSPAHKTLPWSFGHICSSWRQVALTDHRLWNRIRVQVDEFKPFHRQILETVLLRSGSAPLDIEVAAICSFISMVDIFLPQAGRISRLGLRTGTGDFSSLAKFSMPGWTLASLTKASLIGSYLEIPDGGIHIFGDCPLLCKLELRLRSEHQPLSLNAILGLHIPFSQLTELSLDLHFSRGTVFCILKDAPSLVQCSITFRGLGVIDNPALNLVLPHLENLKLSCYQYEILAQMFRHLTLPSLLQIYADCYSTQPGADALPSELLALINRSSCHLTHIAMEGNLGPIVERSHRSLVSVGAKVGSVQSESVFLPASTVQRIARRELSLPRLEELDCMLDLDTFADLKGMVEALWSNGEGNRGATIRKVFRAKCKIASGSGSREDFDRWEEEMRVLFRRLSINGWVELLDNGDSFVGSESDSE